MAINKQKLKDNSKKIIGGLALLSVKVVLAAAYIAITPEPKGAARNIEWKKDRDRFFKNYWKNNF